MLAYRVATTHQPNTIQLLNFNKCYEGQSLIHVNAAMSKLFVQCHVLFDCIVFGTS